MKDAMEEIREDLGPDAVILHSRKIAGTDKTGAQGAAFFEVTAAIEEHSTEEIISKWDQQPKQGAATIGGAFAGVSDVGEKNSRPPHTDITTTHPDDEITFASSPSRPEQSVELRNETETGGGTRDPMALPELSIKLSELHESMLNNEVDEFVAESLVKTALEQTRTAKTGDIMTDFMPRSLERFVKCAGPIRITGPGPKIVALVGPTGVGKTTAIAKLASAFEVLDRRSVALITVDIRRAAAVQQLRTYAEILRVPFEVALNPVELRRAVRKHSHVDIILIDTAGRSPYKWLSILELASFFNGIGDMEIHLVLSAATRLSENLAAIERFSALDVSRLLITKIDEINDYGEILNVASSCRKAISYLTTGQNVPDDIEVATHEKIMKLISQTRDEKK